MFDSVLNAPPGFPKYIRREKKSCQTFFSSLCNDVVNLRIFMKVYFLFVCYRILENFEINGNIGINRSSHWLCFLKSALWKISQNSQENTCASLFLNKVVGLRLDSIVFSPTVTQLTFTCSKSTTETLEKGVKYFQS